MEIEGRESHNTVLFQVHDVKSELYEILDGVRLDEVDDRSVARPEQRVAALTTPTHPLKREEYLEDKAGFYGVINALADGSLRTHIRTRLPYALDVAPLRLRFRWRTVPARANIQPRFGSLADSFIRVEGVGMSVALLGDKYINRGGEARQLPDKNLPFAEHPNEAIEASALIRGEVGRARDQRHN